VAALLGALLGIMQGPEPVGAASSPIQHIVIIYMENHSFDNVLGRLCVQDSRCEAATTGMTHDGQVIASHMAREHVCMDELHQSLRDRAAGGRQIAVTGHSPAGQVTHVVRQW
jgi:phospholipase C